GVRIELDRHFHAVRVGAELYRGLERFAPDTLDVLGLRIGDDAFDHVTHQRQRHADGGDHLGVLGYLVVQAGARGGVRNQRRRTAAFADEQRLVAIELVFGDEVVDHGDDLVGGDIENGARSILDALADEGGERRHGALRRLPVSAGVQSRLGIAEDVGGAGVGDGIAGAVGAAYRDIVG